MPGSIRPDLAERPRPMLTDAAHRLSVDEVRLLWSFVHGDIMDASTRVELRRSWGLCRRHAWGHAVVEIELWQTGSGSHRPFDAAVLAADLIGTAADLARRRSAARLLRALRPEGRCRICTDLGEDQDHPRGIAYAGSDSAALTVETARAVHTVDLLLDTAPDWRDGACPDCATDAGRSAPAAGLPCRDHLLSGRADLDPRVLARRLDGIARGLERFLSSMTTSGTTRRPEDDAAWVHAYGWLARWDLPLLVAGSRTVVVAS